jgi:outer membrane receptor protein involved in Fe transport
MHWSPQIVRIAAHVLVFLPWFAGSVLAQPASLAGTVLDQTGGPLPGVVIICRRIAAAPLQTETNVRGEYRFDGIEAGRAVLSFALVNFAGARRDVDVPPRGNLRLDVVLHLALNADVMVTGKSTFTNIADAENPAENLVGIAQSASQGAITARQLDARPIMRTGEVLETVPGVVISQHSGEGKANQYYLRGFNLDHGTDFGVTVAGMPVNMPSHGHGQGYSDLNFVVDELVSGVQFSKGPYFADQGDFVTAGAANINYVNALGRPIVKLGGGGEGFGHVFAAASPTVGEGHLLAALDLEHNDGPWVRSDNFRKVNALVRYSQGDAVSGFAITGMAYSGKWNATDQIPARAVNDGRIDRFGSIDPTDGGNSYRYSGSVEWQRTRGNATTRVTAYGIAYDLDLFSNFTFFLDDPIKGDQFHQADHRFITGGKVSYRQLTTVAGRSMQNTFGVQLRNDDIRTVGLYRTKARALLDTVRKDSVLETSAAVYAQNETEWTPWLRTLAGVRLDGYRFGVDASNVANSGTDYADLVSPKGGAVIGPWAGTEFYANAGFGFHSNDARGVTITEQPSAKDDGADCGLRIAECVNVPSARVTPLARAKGAEIGLRTVRIPHLQSSLALWSLSLDSELVFVGDAGTTQAARPSHRYGVEFANYYAPQAWLVFDADASISHGRFTDSDPAGNYIPGAVKTVLSGGVTVDDIHNVFGSLRYRYFGPRPLIEDNSVQSKATSLANLEGGYKLTKTVRLAVDVFNLFNATDSDIDYYYASRLPGEPSHGVDDIHFHPTLPRTARVTLSVAF